MRRGKSFVKCFVVDFSGHYIFLEEDVTGGFACT